MKIGPFGELESRDGEMKQTEDGEDGVVDVEVWVVDGA